MIDLSGSSTLARKHLDRQHLPEVRRGPVEGLSAVHQLLRGQQKHVGRMRQVESEIPRFPQSLPEQTGQKFKARRCYF